MNTIEIGSIYERKAIEILKNNGFQNIEWVSIKNCTSNYDIACSKDNINYLIEVRFRSLKSKEPFFCFTKRKLTILRSYYKNVIIMLMNENQYDFLKLEDIKQKVVPIKIKNNKIYVLENDLKNEYKIELMEKGITYPTNRIIRKIRGSKIIVIPSCIINKIGWKEGDDINFTLENNRIVMEKSLNNKVDNIFADNLYIEKVRK